MSINSTTFPPVPKSVDVTPVHKKDLCYQENNYLSLSVLTNPSKIFENILYNQIAQYFEKIFSKHQTGF